MIAIDFFFYLKRVWSIFFLCWLSVTVKSADRPNEIFIFLNLRSQCKNRLLLYSFGNVILYAILQFHFEQLMCYSRSMNPTVAECWIVRIKKSIEKIATFFRWLNYFDETVVLYFGSAIFLLIFLLLCTNLGRKDGSFNFKLETNSIF